MNINQKYEVAVNDCTYHNIPNSGARCDRFVPLGQQFTVMPPNSNYPFQHVVLVDGSGEVSYHEVRQRD